jgi:hypothetical protein
MKRKLYSGFVAFWVLLNSTCSRRDQPSDFFHQDLTRFYIVHLPSRSTALGLYRRVQSGQYELKNVLRSSLDSQLPASLSPEEVTKGWISKLVNETPEILVAQPNSASRGLKKMMPSIDGEIVYFVSQPPDPRFLLTVPLESLVNHLKNEIQEPGE